MYGSSVWLHLARKIFSIGKKNIIEITRVNGEQLRFTYYRPFVRRMKINVYKQFWKHLPNLKWQTVSKCITQNSKNAQFLVKQLDFCECTLNIHRTFTFTPHMYIVNWNQKKMGFFNRFLKRSKKEKNWNCLRFFASSISNIW